MNHRNGKEGRRRPVAPENTPADVLKKKRNGKEGQCNLNMNRKVKCNSKGQWQLSKANEACFFKETEYCLADKMNLEHSWGFPERYVMMPGQREKLDCESGYSPSTEGAMLKCDIKAQFTQGGHCEPSCEIDPERFDALNFKDFPKILRVDEKFDWKCKDGYELWNYSEPELDVHCFAPDTLSIHGNCQKIKPKLPAHMECEITQTTLDRNPTLPNTLLGTKINRVQRLKNLCTSGSATPQAIIYCFKKPKKAAVRGRCIVDE